jgi:putative Mn2+ efflux pump MntP
MKRRKNPLAASPPPSDVEMVAGGIASILLVGLGVSLIAEALKQSQNTTSTLEDTSSLAALAALAPI